MCQFGAIASAITGLLRSHGTQVDSFECQRPA